MRPFIGLATLGLVAMPEPALAVTLPDAGAGLASGGAGETVWFGLRRRPFSVARLIGLPQRQPSDAARARALGPAPIGGQLISFAGSSTDAPSTSLLLRDAPRFSRLPGRQVDDYEVGLRTALADTAVTLQAGLSYNKFRNLQTTLRQGDRLTIASVGRAKTYGLETMARWSPTAGISLFVAGAYREARFKNQVRDGRKFRLSPDRSASLGAVMLVPVGTGRIAFIPSIAYQSAMGLDGDDGGMGATALINAQLGYAFSDAFEIEALASNLLDRPYARPSARGAATLIAGEPRVLGVRARLRFGAGH
ncbi:MULTISPECIES: TonB-dependent receptor domain-containing protein [unclassified Sphingomonas]|uniref:TonB-dependent receptor domain-containing protein n=1 Tax=unclassified Sphingomonas TaxID=196159 RepID=UPI0006FADA1E|nr:MULTISPECIES: TonB-dependent receptor [unclassified Sphingomonas]KQX24825.1 TonB-dependent receptor [Sphingomonas sp. Root1294]KQY69813.1 TonB-dependent receptor [Sphingomonas sp. Root50]KRB93927.1 TonB-dependent receptor [Sphingomonas sp. Root720]